MELRGDELGVRHEALDVLHVDGGNGLVAALLARDLALVAAVEVVLPTVLDEELATLGDADALGNGLVGLELRHSGYDLRPTMAETLPPCCLISCSV